MTVTLQSTSRLVHVNGVPGRVWEGKTESGIPVFCIVTRVAVSNEHDTTEFERELEQHAAPTEVALQVFPARMVL